MLFIYILPSVGSCTTCLRTKFHHYFQITLVYFTTKCKQVTNTLLPSHTCYPHFLLRVWGSITPYMYSLLKRGFFIWLPSGTDSEMQVTRSICHFDGTLKIAFQNRSYQMSVYGYLAWKHPYLKILKLVNCSRFKSPDHQAASKWPHIPKISKQDKYSMGQGS